MMDRWIRALRQEGRLGVDAIKDAFIFILTGKAREDELIEFLLLLEEHFPSAEEIAAVVDVLVQSSAKLPAEHDRNLQSKTLIDTCGTGGDHSHTINFSTITALGLAAWFSSQNDGYVVKHGNRSITSVSGSADILESLGIPIDHTGDQIYQDLIQNRFAFLFAPLWHPAMKHVASARKKIKGKTIFNLLGPLVNPLKPPYQIIGVFSLDVLDLYAEIYAHLHRQGAFILCGEIGEGRYIDELSPLGITHYRKVDSDGQIEKGQWDPRELGIAIRYEAWESYCLARDRERATERARDLLFQPKEEDRAIDLVSAQMAIAQSLMEKRDPSIEDIARHKSFFLEGGVRKWISSLTP